MSDLFGNHIVGFPTRRLIFSLRYNVDNAVFSYHFHGHPPKVIPKQVNDGCSRSEIFVFHDSRDVIQAKSAVQGIPIADRNCHTQNGRVHVERMSRSVPCFTHNKSRTAEILNEYEIS